MSFVTMTNRSDAANRVLYDFCVAYSIPKEPAVFDLLFEDALTLTTRKKNPTGPPKHIWTKKDIWPASCIPSCRRK